MNRGANSCLQQCIVQCSTNMNRGYQGSVPGKDTEKNAMQNDLLKLREQIQGWRTTEANDKVMNQILPNVILSLNPPKGQEDEPQESGEMMNYMIRDHIDKNMAKDHHHSKRWRSKIYRHHQYLRIRMNHSVYWIRHNQSYYLVKHR
jgi:hypothetical protein